MLSPVKPQLLQQLHIILLLHHLKKNEYLQVLYMAPTEILANQHFESFCKMFAPFGKTIGLITSSGCKNFQLNQYH